MVIPALSGRLRMTSAVLKQPGMTVAVESITKGGHGSTAVIRGERPGVHGRLCLAIL